MTLRFLTSLEQYSSGTMSVSTKLIIIFLLVRLLGTGHCLISDGFSKVFGTAGSATNVRTTRLLNQLCSESQNGNLARDACYGCFFRASTEPSGYPTLQSMTICADSYLNNTDYGHCRNYLKNSTNPLDTRVSPTIIYCTFLECVRQVNKDALDALEAIRLEPHDPWSTKAKYIRKRTSQLLATKNYFFALRGICVVRNVNVDSNTIRPGAEPTFPRRNNYIDPIVRRRGPENVVQFYINGRKASPSFRQYDRMYSGEDTMRNSKPNNWRLPQNHRFRQ